MRGFLGGVSVGAVVAVIGAAVWSLSIPLPRAVEVPSETPAPVLAPRVDTTLPQDTPGADSDVVERAPVAPADVSEATGTPEVIDTDTPDRPAVVTAAPAPEAEAAPSDVPTTAAPSAAPAPDSSVTLAPEQPGSEQDPVAATESSTPPEDVSVLDPTLSAPSDTADAPVVLEQDSATGPKTAPLEAPVVVVPDLGVAPDTTLPPAIATPIAPPKIVLEGETLPEDSQRIADLPQANASGTATGPTIGTKVVPLTDRDKQPAETAVISGATPFERNAEPADPEAGLPLMSIVLIEEEGSVGAEALEEFPYPITFAIDPSDPKAAARMAARRAAGFEVMILADLPREGSAQDAETALPVWFERLPQAMGILEGIDTGVQGNRPLADQVASIAQAAGYGLVLQDNGLNTVQKMALRDGVPAGVVFRDFDGAGQDPRAIRRFLDQAAFRAGQEGAVIMLGRLKPDTISALLVWGLQDRANRVALVPVSISLNRMLDPLE